MMKKIFKLTSVLLLANGMFRAAPVQFNLNHESTACRRGIMSGQSLEIFRPLNNNSLEVGYVVSHVYTAKLAAGGAGLEVGAGIQLHYDKPNIALTVGHKHRLQRGDQGGMTLNSGWFARLSRFGKVTENYTTFQAIELSGAMYGEQRMPDLRLTTGARITL